MNFHLNIKTGLVQSFPVPTGDDWIEMHEPQPAPHYVAKVIDGVGVWVEPEPVYPQMSSLDFLRLFDPERRAIKQAAMQDVDIGIWYDDTVAAQFVTYSDPRVEQGLVALVDAGLLTAERKAEIVSRMQAS